MAASKQVGMYVTSTLPQWSPAMVVTCMHVIYVHVPTALASFPVHEITIIYSLLWGSLRLAPIILNTRITQTIKAEYEEGVSIILLVVSLQTEMFSQKPQKTPALFKTPLLHTPNK